MSKIHPQALVSPTALVAKDVEIGPFSIIEDDVVIGAGCKIASHAKICSGVTMGKNNILDHGVVIGGNPQDLSFAPTTKSGVLIGDENTFREYVTINRSSKTGGNTIIGDRNFFMAVSHLAHDVTVGNDNVLANNVMIAGHVCVGNKIFFGGGTGIHQFIRVGDFAMTQGNCGMTRDIPPFCVVHKINQLSGLNVIGLRRSGFTREELKEIKLAYSLLLNSKFTREEALVEADRADFGPMASKLVEAVRSPSSKGILTR
ncbi:MAG: acyl-ACP--UDP-N-acetylglucosamine O-acyltransferase [Akkermansiaceae bacterium]